MSKPGGAISKPGGAISKPGGAMSKPGGGMSKPGGGMTPKAMQVLNWFVMAVSFALLAATSVFGMEVLDQFCANKQYDGATDDVVSEEAYTTWDAFMWGGLGAGIAPAITLLMLLLVQVLCTKSPVWSASAVTCAMMALLVATSFGLTATARLQGLFCGMLVGMLLMILVLGPTHGQSSSGSVMVQVGTAFLLFGLAATVLGSYAISQVDACNAQRGCFPAVASATDDAPAAGDAADDNPFSTTCDWSCCTDKTEDTTCAEYAATSTDNCGDCQPCLVDSTIITKLGACVGVAVLLLVIGIVLIVVKFAVPVM
jgi:hypothetical protein